MLAPHTVAADLGVTLPIAPITGRHTAAPRAHLERPEAISVGIVRLLNGWPPVTRTEHGAPGRHHRDDAPQTVLILLPR